MNKKIFNSLLNNCQQIKFEDDVRIYYVWNKNIDRLLKFNKILSCNDKLEFDFNKDTDIYFSQDEKYKNLICDYNKVWSKIGSENRTNHLTTSNLIKRWLKEDKKWKQYTPILLSLPTLTPLKEDKKWKQYTSRL